MTDAPAASGELLDAALSYAGRGLPVFPCHPQTKRPITERGFKDASVDEAIIRAWWSQHPDAMIGVPTGEPSRTWVLDVDDPATFENACSVQIPATRRCETGKGYHLYFKHDPANVVRNSQCSVDKATGEKRWPLAELPGAEVRGEGGYVIVPPSLHPSGRRYQWASEANAVPAPAELLSIVRKDSSAAKASRPSTAFVPATGGDTNYGLAALDDECAAIRKAPDGAQEKTLNDAALKIGGLVAGGHLSLATARGRLIGAGLEMPSYDPRDQWTVDAVVSKVERALSDGTATPRGPAERAIKREYAIAAEGRGEAFDPGTGEVACGDPCCGPDAAISLDPVPIDLWAKYDAPKLPVGLLPTAIEQFAMRHGAVMGADPAGLAMAALAVCSAAIHDEIAVQVKTYDPSWRESARLWIGMVGPPSRKKTPIMRAAMHPINRRDGQLMAEYMAEKAAFDALDKATQKTTDAPKMRRHVVSDATVESLQEVLAHSTGGVISEQDELSGWFGGMDKYAPGKASQSDRAFWLKAFNGGRYTLDRISRGSKQIPNLSIGLLGGIQPEPLRKITTDSVDDGLIQRLIPVILGPADVGTDAPGGNAVSDYERLVERLLIMRAPPKTGLQHDYDQRPQPLRFSDDARNVRERLEREHLALVQALERTSPKLAAHFGKYDGLFARLCVVWHCVENADGGPEPPVEITGRTALLVAEFMEMFIRPSAIAFYAGLLGLSDGHDLILGLAAYIVAEGLEEVNARTVQRSTRSLRSFTADEARQLCEKLEAFGWLDPIDPKARSNTPRWRVIPAVHAMFAEKGRQDAERRKAAREALQSALGER